ncbi:hypothetical protein BRADI_1g77318v3 [Brachypodium distachyon]|uniref:Uncharacterized protein n=1 Tax=Brachypodium distachyon TaxID=15368 RepID=A0A2K2DVL8_BRADI|nr:hypothetical protein BRADI_1g77318v3 [Brachypodium distachyon]
MCKDNNRPTERTTLHDVGREYARPAAVQRTENEEEEEMLTSHAGNSCGFVGDSRVGLHREFGIPFILSCKPGVLLLLQFARLSDF